MATGTDIHQPAIEQFQEIFRSSLIQPDDPTDDEERTIYKTIINKLLRLIGRCAKVADVNFGPERGLDIAIRSGGHNGPGPALVVDGLVSRENGATHRRITHSIIELRISEIDR